MFAAKDEKNPFLLLVMTENTRTKRESVFLRSLRYEPEAGKMTCAAVSSAVSTYKV